MGCCLSRSPGGQNSHNSGSTNARASNTSGSGAAHHRAPERRINKPLRRHIWTSHDRRVWTRATLDRERTAFFDTRVTGHPEVWQILHTVVQKLWTPVDLSHGVADEGLADAQAILDAGEITLPTGDLAQGAYDSTGQYYQLNEWVVSDPPNIMDTEQYPMGGVVGDDGRDLKDDLAGEEFENETTQRKEEKGKAVAQQVRARLSLNDQVVIVSSQSSDSVETIAAKILAASELSKKTIRLFLLGRVLEPHLPLDVQGWTPDKTVNAYVFDQ